MSSSGIENCSSTTEKLLHGKVAIITGAASDTGKEIARTFVRHGARVFLADRRNCEKIAEDINTEVEKSTADVIKAKAMMYDVSERLDFRQEIEHVKAEHGRLDIFYHHAESNRVSYDDGSRILKDTMEANVRSVLDRIDHVGMVMRGNKKPAGGCILCGSSTMGLLADVMPSAYSISHAAGISVIRAKAAELSSIGVRVNAISQGSVDPRVLMSIFPHATDEQLKLMVENYMAKQAAKEEVAQAAVYLASDYGKSVTGHNLVLNGKFTVSPFAARL